MRGISDYKSRTHAVITALVIPAAYHSLSPPALADHAAGGTGDLPTGGHRDAAEGLLAISRGTAILLLIVYIAYLVFQVRRFVFAWHGISKSQHSSEHM